MANHPEDGLPILSCGKHNDARDGACLMEYVSVLAGERFTDHPRSTDRLLGHLARMVNDATSAPGRPALARLAADMVGTAGADAKVHEELVQSCFTVVRKQRGAPQPNRGRVGALVRNRTARRRDVERAVRALRSVPSHAQRDIALYTMLSEAVTVCRRGRDADGGAGQGTVRQSQGGTQRSAVDRRNR